ANRGQTRLPLNEGEKDSMDKERLPPHWEKVHGAIWLIGLAYLFWSGNIVPGILVLVAISGLAQAVLMAYVRRNRAVETLATERELFLPATCPNCGGPLNPASVRWKGRQSAACLYCGSTVKATVKAPDKTPNTPQANANMRARA
ncbi:MAG TPA: hypothetical protein VFT99_02200, partial [Roseiflexaceae bacterium]|nr:hypothetical protein [Roseiflexaceae bacterium]